MAKNANLEKLPNRKSLKNVAIRCQILRLSIQFLVELRPRPHWGAYSALTDPLAGFKGSYF